MINFDFSSHCTGCGVCSDICPKHCIDMIVDKRGFVIPSIDKTVCVDCGLCERTCPILTAPELYTRKAVFCAYNIDTKERAQGSSGSVMLALAKYVLSKEGVVYGAAFDENLQVHHTRAVSYEEVVKQSKSKYIQSSLHDIYRSVKEDLNNKIYTMFVGTPCQTQALSNFIGKKNREYLLLVDFICHGVPSQFLFNQAISIFEKKKDCKVVAFSFREKSESRLRNYKVEYIKNGNTLIESGEENAFPYYCGYLKYITFRDSCYECKCATTSRASDITLGDMWGYEKEKDFTKGFSLIYLNTQKGKEYFANIKGSLLVNELTFDDPCTFNFAYDHHQEKDLWQRLFSFSQRHFPYTFVERFFFRSYRDVGFIHRCAFVFIGKLNKFYNKKNS